MPEERLQKVLAAAGVASRRGAEELIAAGRVSVDGRVATVGDRADPAAAVIAVDGRVIGRPAELRHLVVNKPIGVTSTVRDPHAARTVLELVPPELRGGARLYPVGRLDLDSEGILLLTNDGPWADGLLHPRYAVEREYAVAVAKPLGARELQALVAGVELDDGWARAVAVRPATITETRRLADLLTPRVTPFIWYRMTLAQGWKRQVRRMFAAVGEPVRRLVRVRFGTVRLEDLPTGACRALTRAEVARLAALGAPGGTGRQSGGTGRAPSGSARAPGRPREGR